MKGSLGKFVLDKISEYIAECGFGSGDILLKSDQEPAIEILIKDIVAERGNEMGSKTIVEESPVGSKGSNGVAERAVKEIEGQLRVMKLALEDRIGKEIDAEACVLTFAAEYASYLINRLLLGKDGKTAGERSKGKSATVLGLEFGEKVLYKKKAKAKMEKINSRWEYGIFVGVRQRSGELWVATQEGVRKVRSVRRIPIEERWSEDSVKWVKNVPWHLYKDQEDADGDIPEEKLVQPQAARLPQSDPAEVLQEPIVVKTRKVPPRAFQIRKEDAEHHGYTRGCGGCQSWFRGLGRQPHTQACRDRFAELMKDEARYQNAEKRKSEFEEKMRRKEERKKLRKEGPGGGATAGSSGQRPEDREQGLEEQRKREREEDLGQEGEGQRKKERGAPQQLDPAASSGAASGQGDRNMEQDQVHRGLQGGEVGGAGREPAEAPKKRKAEGEGDEERLTRDEEGAGGEVGHEGMEVEIKGLEFWEDVIDKIAEEQVRRIAQVAVDRSWAWDDVHGGYLNREKVFESREEEVDYMKNKGVWREVDEEECWRVTEKAPVTVKWVDADKGSEDSPLIRSRLVARDFKKQGRRTARTCLQRLHHWK